MSFRSGLLAGLTTLALLVAPTAAAAEPGDPPVDSLTPPAIQGSVRVGSTLTSTEPVWSETGVTTTYQWLRGDAPAPDQDPTDDAYTLTAADLGLPITVVATGTKPGFSDGQAASTPVGPVQPGVFSARHVPRITGQARVGRTLSVVPPVWTQAGVATRYQWRRGSMAVSSGPTYLLKAADVGQRITARATGTKLGYREAIADAAPTAEVRKVPATVTVRGTSPKVGALRLSITVSAPGETVPRGSVLLKRGTKVLKGRLTLTGGKASYSATGIKPARYTYSVRYAGTSRIAGDTGSVAVSIKAKTRPTITLKPTTSVGKARIGITVTAAKQAPLGGTAYVKEGRRTLKSSIKVVRGKATFSTSGVKAGRHTYLVGYRGTSQVRSGTRSVTVRVPAPAKLVRYPNCAALNRVHPHGVGRSNAKDKTSGAPPVTTFLRNTRLYELNTGRDRDDDGVACEKR